MNYVPDHYWDSRLRKNFNLKNAGFEGMSESYNKVSYEIKMGVLEETLRKHQLKIQGKKIIDVGCGTGAFLDFYIERGAIYTGIDISEYAITRLSKVYPAIPFYKIDITLREDVMKLLAYGRYDLVHCFDVLYHIVEDMKWKNAIANVSLLLKEKGIMLFTVKMPKHETYIKPHCKFRTMITSNRVLGEHNLEIIEVTPLFFFLNRGTRLEYVNKLLDRSSYILRFLDEVFRRMHLCKNWANLKIVLAQKVRARA